VGRLRYPVDTGIWIKILPEQERAGEVARGRQKEAVKKGLFYGEQSVEGWV